MFKKLSFIFLLIISVFGLVLGGKYVYDKQAYQLSFSNFNVSSEATCIYIPNIKVFYKLNIDTKTFDLPSDIVVAKTKVLSFFEKNGITDEVYISYDKQGYTVTLKQNDFDSEHFIAVLKHQLYVDVNEQNHTINIGATTFYYFTVKDFFAFSTSEIQINTVKQFDKPKGNYHYLVQKSNSSQHQSFKHHDNSVYSFTFQKKDTIKGMPVSPSLYYSTIPANFDTLRFYGSSRFNNDIKSLTGLNGHVDFFSWVDNSIIHLKKDSLEILIGIQNEFQNLSDLLDEQTIGLSNDSLLPPSIFKNNYEIHKFQSSYLWNSIIPFNAFEFNYYSEFNYYNVLGNSEQAMNWFITELQLGNVFSTIAHDFHHPGNVHKLTLTQSELTHDVVSKNWISRTECFISKSVSINTAQSKMSSLPLVSTFPVELKNFKIKSLVINDTLEVLLFNDEKIISYSSSGEINWVKQLDSPLISFPIEVKIDSNQFVALLMKQSIDVIDKNNLSVLGFPYLLNSTVTKGNVIQNATNFRVLVETENQIISINEKGKLTEGWADLVLSNKLKSAINIGSNKSQTLISYSDVDDSLFVFNKFGQSILNTNIKLNLKHKSNFISENSDTENLRIYGFSNPYIMNQLVKTGQKDSLKINQKLAPTGVQWVKHNARIYLVVEEFDRVILFNEFGLLEKEIQKPIPNLKLISNFFFDDAIIIFSDFKNKKLYLLDSFGRNICEYPISGESNFNINYKSIVVYFNSKIYIYSLETY